MNSVQVIQIFPGTERYAEALRVRIDVLRRPLGLDGSSYDPAEEARLFHYIALSESGVAGTVCLERIDQGTAKMRQVAVLDSMRGLGIGAALVKLVEREALAWGCRWIVANARETALGFYVKLGYESLPGVFLEVGIPHRRVRRCLVKEVGAETPEAAVDGGK